MTFTLQHESTLAITRKFDVIFKYNTYEGCCTVWGFIHGTVRACCRPHVAQRLLYNGHKRHHALKYQAVSTANGLVANLYGPIEGNRHDCALLATSGLLLQQFSHGPNGELPILLGADHMRRASPVSLADPLCRDDI